MQRQVADDLGDVSFAPEWRRSRAEGGDDVAIVVPGVAQLSGLRRVLAPSGPEELTQRVGIVDVLTLRRHRGLQPGRLPPTRTGEARTNAAMPVSGIETDWVA